MKKFLLLVSLLIASNFSYASMDPFVDCVGQLGYAVDSVELEVINDRYGREGVKATVYHLNETTTTYLTEVATEKVALAYKKKAIKLNLRNPEASPKFITITINGEKGTFGQTGRNTYEILNCRWAR